MKLSCAVTIAGVTLTYTFDSVEQMLDTLNFLVYQNMSATRRDIVLCEPTFTEQVCKFSYVFTDTGEPYMEVVATKTLDIVA